MAHISQFLSYIVYSTLLPRCFAYQKGQHNILCEKQIGRFFQREIQEINS